MSDGCNKSVMQEEEPNKAGGIQATRIALVKDLPGWQYPGGLTFPAGGTILCQGVSRLPSADVQTMLFTPLLVLSSIRVGNDNPPAWPMGTPETMQRPRRIGNGKNIESSAS